MIYKKSSGTGTEDDLFTDAAKALYLRENPAPIESTTRNLMIGNKSRRTSCYSGGAFTAAAKALYLRSHTAVNAELSKIAAVCTNDEKTEGVVSDKAVPISLSAHVLSIIKMITKFGKRATKLAHTGASTYAEPTSGSVLKLVKALRPFLGADPANNVILDLGSGAGTVL